METSGLKGHITHCSVSTNQVQVLGEFGITCGSAAKLTPENVREYFALWVAESACPFSIVGDSYVSDVDE
jgi:hypothetical protein